MESFWEKISNHFSAEYTSLIAYPKITRIPDSMRNSNALALEYDFNNSSPLGLIHNCRFIKEHRIKVIYLSDKSDCDWRYIAYRACGVEHILVHDHTPGVRSNPSFLKGIIKSILRRMSWITVDAAIGATDFVRQRLININRLPEKKCFSVPNGLPPLKSELVAFNIHQQFNIPASAKIMVMTGRAHRYKGVTFALQCIALLKSKAEAYPHFLFVGDGPHLNEFKQLACELGIMEDCTFSGRRGDVPEILDACDFAIHPSEGEVGYSLSILEYMRAGLPVIVPDDPSVCGATEHEINGMIYKKGDLETATKTISALLSNDRLIRRLGENAIMTANRYSLENTHKALIDVFEKTLSS